MTTQPLQTPSCSKAFERSMEWTKRVLFPFDFSRWITFAVSAWLMSFGQGGGTNFNFSGGGNSGGGGGNNLPGGHELQEAAQWFDNHFGTILLVGAAVVLLIIGISALLTWLTSRAEFMFLDGVVTGEPKIAESWSSTKELGNSLFQFRFCLFLANFFASLLAIAILAVPVLAGMRNSESIEAIFGRSLVTGIIIAVIFVPIMMVVAVANMFIEDFVIAIMYRRKVRFISAVRMFWPLFHSNLMTFAFYWLVRLLIAVGLALGILAISTAACCLTCGILALPVLSAIPILPFLFFKRAFPLFYIEQFSEEWEMFNRAPEPPMPVYGPASAGGYPPIPTY
ncbi:MAG TPA: hypothetical protein PKD58_04825 [Candidatus Sumerlaeota bacterium]|nr:hypothetical protein [Candidatus Sumerlaeota bacterium]